MGSKICDASEKYFRRPAKGSTASYSWLASRFGERGGGAGRQVSLPLIAQENQVETAAQYEAFEGSLSKLRHSQHRRGCKQSQIASANNEMQPARWTRRGVAPIDKAGAFTCSPEAHSGRSIALLDIVPTENR